MKLKVYKYLRKASFNPKFAGFYKIKKGTKNIKKYLLLQKDAPAKPNLPYGTVPRSPCLDGKTFFFGLRLYLAEKLAKMF